MNTPSISSITTELQTLQNSWVLRPSVLSKKIQTIYENTQKLSSEESHSANEIQNILSLCKLVEKREKRLISIWAKIPFLSMFQKTAHIDWMQQNFAQKITTPSKEPLYPTIEKSIQDAISPDMAILESRYPKALLPEIYTNIQTICSSKKEDEEKIKTIKILIEDKLYAAFTNPLLKEPILLDPASFNYNATLTQLIRNFLPSYDSSTLTDLNNYLSSKESDVGNKRALIDLLEDFFLALSGFVEKIA